MDIRDKIIKALREFLEVDYVRLQDDDGISGFVVSPTFQRMSMLDRQGLIDRALSDASTALNPKEKRQVVMIAGLTPMEYETVGAKIQIQKVEAVAKGALEIILRGATSDAEYVRRALTNQNAVKTSEPKPVSGAAGTTMSFRVTGLGATPMTKATAIQILNNDPYIQVMPDAVDERPGVQHSPVRKKQSK
jgi:hypothetical protein